MPLHRSTRVDRLMRPVHRWVWSDFNRRVRKLLAFSEVETDGGRDILRAAEVTPDPLLRRLYLEHAIDECERELEPLKAFIIPGGSRKGAALHVARTVCRRAERRVVRLQREVEIPSLVVIYLNRLSDLLFMLGRVANVRTGAGEVTW